MQPPNQKGWHMALEEARVEEEVQQVLGQRLMPPLDQMQLQTKLGLEGRPMMVHRTRKNVHFEKVKWGTERARAMLETHRTNLLQAIETVLTWAHL